MKSGSVPLPVKLGFGMGQAAESVKNFGFGTLLLLYYNQVLGLSGTYAGLALFIALVVDAISDPAVGSWSDGFKSKWGRRHPFMIASILPMGVTYYFLFAPPDGLTEFQLFLWFTTFCILVRTALTFFNVPYLSLGAELTQGYHERTKIVVIRMAFGFVSTLVVIAVTWNYFFLKTIDNPTPHLTQAPYFNYALLCSLLMMAMMIVCIWGTRSAIPHLAGAKQEARKFSFRQVYIDLYQALKNHSFRVLFFSTLLFFVYVGTHSALSMHLKTFYWQLDTKGIQYWQYAYVAGGFCGLPLAPYMNRWVDKKWTVIIGCLGSAVASITPVLLSMAGLMPTDKEILVPVLVVLSFLSTVMMIQAAATVPSMMGDIADQHELSHGTRQEGIYFGSFNFSSKCTTALGNLVAGLALDLINFPVNSKPDTVTEDVIFNFGVMYCSVALILIFSTWVFWSYGLTKDRHDKIIEQLKARNHDEKNSLEP